MGIAEALSGAPGREEALGAANDAGTAPMPQGAPPAAPTPVPLDREHGRLAQGGASSPAADPSPSIPEDIADGVAASHFEYGKAAAFQPIPIASLAGGDPQMRSPIGYPVVKDDGTVLAGQDHVDAVRSTGADHVQALVVKDLAAPYDVRPIEVAAKKASGPGLHPDQVKGVVRQALDKADERGISGAREFRVPGFEAHYHAALDAMRDQRREVPAAQTPVNRPQPGGPPVMAQDGHHYVHAPHSGGLYQRVTVGG